MSDAPPHIPPLTQTPYGHQAPGPAPAYDPRMGRRPGETMCKVWGIVLLVLGLLGVANTMVGIAMMMGGVSGGMFAPTLSPDGKAELDQFMTEMMDASLARPTFWIYAGSELLVVVLSIVAGVMLAIRPRIGGAKLALARALCVLVFLPVYGYEQIKALESSSQAQMRILEADQKSRGGRPLDKDFASTMEKIMAGVSYGAIFLAVAVIVAINGLLAYHMTRPNVKAYLASVASHQVIIPGYDPSMGLLPGATPAQPPRTPQPPGAI